MGSDFYGCTYRYPTPEGEEREIGVIRGLGHMWIVAWQSKSGGRHRVKTQRLLPTIHPEQLQAQLDAWAEERDLAPAEAQRSPTDIRAGDRVGWDSDGGSRRGPNFGTVIAGPNEYGSLTVAADICGGGTRRVFIASGAVVKISDGKAGVTPAPQAENGTMETRMIAELAEHPGLAEFPMLPAGQYEALKASIGQHGLLKALVCVVAGKGEFEQKDAKEAKGSGGPGTRAGSTVPGALLVIDGRNRLRAARELGIESVPVEILPGETDPLTYAIESAVTGRNLTKSGVVLVLLLMHPELAAEREARMTEGACHKMTGGFVAVADRYGVPRQYFSQLAAIQDGCDEAEWEAVKGNLLAGESSIPALFAGLGGKIQTKGKRRKDAEYGKLAPGVTTTMVNIFKRWTQLEFLSERLAERTAQNIEEMFRVAPDCVRKVQAAVIVEDWPEHERKELLKKLRAATAKGK